MHDRVLLLGLRRYPYYERVRPRTLPDQSPTSFVGFEKISIPVGFPTCEKWLIVNGLAQSTRPCTFVGFEKISILRASPAPDSAGPESGYQSPAPQLSWDIRTKSLTVTG